jgi:hypothetical protein
MPKIKYANAKRDRNGKKAQGKEMKPADMSCAGDCQYKVKEEVVDKKRVKEKEVFDKSKK